MIEINGIYKNFGAKQALRDVSFNVAEGEIMGFLGPNGAGKTTTRTILTGYLSATAGTARIDGVDVLEKPLVAKSKIGFLPEQPPLYMDMTVKEYLNFVYGLKNCRLPRAQHIKEICEVVRIGDVYGRIIKNLSKGYRQRVGIAQALIGNPKVLIFDEPTVGLDPKQIIEIRNLIKLLGKEHTVILSTHILPEVQAVCDRIVVIDKGVIVATPGVKYAELLGRRDTDSFSYMLESEDKVDIRKPLFYNLARSGWPLIGLEGMELNIEDIFIRLIDRDKEKAKKGSKKGGNKQ